jgi:ABC-type bacteriocin/lantibiotic exporter with double-glycine peptidase domain
MKPAQRFFALLKTYKKEIGYIYGYALFTGLISLTLPLGMQAIVNFIMMGQLSTSWVVLVIILTVALILYSIFLILQVHVTESVQQKIFIVSAFEFVYRISRFKKSALFNRSTLELVNRFFDVLTIQKEISKVLLDFSVNSLQILVGLILLSFYHPFFFVFSLIVVAIIYFVFKYLAPKGLDTSLRESTYKYELVHWMEETARNSDMLKINIEKDIHLEKTDKLLQKYLLYRNKHFKILRVHYISLAILKVILISGLLIAGSIMVINNQLNLGQFIASEIIVFMVISSVEKLVYTLDTIYDVLTSIEKVGNIFDIPIEKEKEKDKINLPAQQNFNIKFNQVSIEINHKIIQNNLNFELHPGDKVILLGNTGSGTTSLLYLLAAYIPASGKITYNDIPLEQINHHSIRQNTGFIFNESKILEGTIIENIALSSAEYDIERIQEICNIVKLNEYISKFKNGFNTVLSPERNYLSKEVQLKLEIARIIYKQPTLLLIDNDFHCLSAADRKHIIEYIHSAFNKSIVVYNCKSKFIAQKCNKLLHLEDQQSTYYPNIQEALKNQVINNILNINE